MTCNCKDDVGSIGIILEPTAYLKNRNIISVGVECNGTLLVVEYRNPISKKTERIMSTFVHDSITETLWHLSQKSQILNLLSKNRYEKPISEVLERFIEDEWITLITNVGKYSI